MQNMRIKSSFIYYCLIIYICSMPLYMLGSFGIGSIPKVISIGIASVVLIYLLNKKLIITRTLALWFLYLAYVSLSCIWSGNTSLSLSVVYGMAQVFAISFLLSQCGSLTEKQIEGIKNAALAVSMSVIVLTLFSSQLTEYGQRAVLVIAGNTNMDQNEACTYLLLGVAISMDRIFKNKKTINKLPYILIVGLSLYCPLFLGSRGGLIACFSVVVFELLYLVRHSRKTILGVILVAFIFWTVLEISVIPNLPANLLDRFTFESVSGSLRFNIWEDYYTGFFKDPLRVLFGWGPYGAVAISITNCLHNIFFQVLVDSGIIGFCIYIAFILSLFKSAIKSGHVVTSAFLGVQVSLLSLSTYANMKMVWVIYLLCIVMGNVYMQKDNCCSTQYALYHKTDTCKRK